MGMKCNKTVGNGFEAKFCDILSEDGFWAHNMAQKSEGQPADIIATRNNIGYLIDCKVCADDSFDTSRIEPNQHSAMALWKEQGNDERWFALHLKQSDEIWMVSYDSFVNSGKKIFNYNLISYYGKPYEKWVSLCV